MKKVEISYKHFKEVCAELAVTAGLLKPHRIVCIARGGLTASHIIAKALSVPVAFVAFYSPKTCSTMGIEDDGHPYVVVDDMIDQGRTRDLVRDYLSRIFPSCRFTYLSVFQVGNVSSDLVGRVRKNEWLVMPNEEASRVVVGDKSLFSDGASLYGYDGYHSHPGHQA